MCIFEVNADEILGTIQLPDHEQNVPINIELTTLKIPDQFPIVESEIIDGEKDEHQSPEKSKRFSDATPLPPVDFHCKSCIYNNKLIGNTN